jgi:hypothetical protein
VQIAAGQKRPAGEPAAPGAWHKQRLPEAAARLAWGAIAASQRSRASWPTRRRPWGVEQMARVPAPADGARGVWGSVARALTGSLQAPDICDASGQVAQAGQRRGGEGTPEATAAPARGRARPLAAGRTGLCRPVGEGCARGDPPGRRASLDRLVGRGAKHGQGSADAERWRSGQAIGSGVAGGQGKTLGLRLPARGARWRTQDVQSMSTPACARNGDQWDSYWAQAA